MDTASKGYILMAESREWSYPQIDELLAERIASYEKILADLDAGAGEARLNPYFRNTFPEYFALIGIPDSLDGSAPSLGNAEAKVLLLTTSPLFPGLVFESGGTRVLVELKGTAGEIAGRTELDLSRNPFRASVAFHKVSGEGIAGKGSVEWDGATLTIRENVSVFSTKILFSGRRR